MPPKWQRPESSSGQTARDKPPLSPQAPLGDNKQNSNTMANGFRELPPLSVSGGSGEQFKAAFAREEALLHEITDHMQHETQRLNLVVITGNQVLGLDESDVLPVPAALPEAGSEAHAALCAQSAAVRAAAHGQPFHVVHCLLRGCANMIGGWLAFSQEGVWEDLGDVPVTLAHGTVTEMVRIDPPATPADREEDVYAPLPPNATAKNFQSGGAVYAPNIEYLPTNARTLPQWRAWDKYAMQLERTLASGPTHIFVADRRASEDPVVRNYVDALAASVRQAGGYVFGVHRGPKLTTSGNEVVFHTLGLEHIALVLLQRFSSAYYLRDTTEGIRFFSSRTKELQWYRLTIPPVKGEGLFPWRFYAHTAPHPNQNRIIVARVPEYGSAHITLRRFATFPYIGALVAPGSGWERVSYDKEDLTNHTSANPSMIYVEENVAGGPFTMREEYIEPFAEDANKDYHCTQARA